MATLRAGEINGFAKNPPDNIAGVLIYGPNEGRIAEISARIVKSVTGELDDPFNLVNLSESQLKETLGLLRDEMQAISFTGGRKVIWIKDPGAAFTRQLTGLFDEQSGDNLLVVQAGPLKKSSAVRKTFENSNIATSIACYEDTARDLAELIARKVKEEGKTIDVISIGALIESVGTNRSLILSEVEKLLLFGSGQSAISIENVKALCSDPLGGTLDDLLDMTLTGDVTGCTSKFRDLASSGIQPAQILSVLSGQLTRLQRFRLDINKGQSIESVVKNARPPIFFKKQDITRKQLSTWHDSILEKALKIVYEAIFLTRQNPNLAESLCERALIALSKTAKLNAG